MVPVRRLDLLQKCLRIATLAALLGYAVVAVSHPGLPLSGRVLDSNGNPLHQAAVSLRTDDGHGADVITVFTDTAGSFAMPAPVSGINFEQPAVTVRKPGYRQVHTRSELAVTGRNEAIVVSLVMQPTANQVEVAPASAWLAQMNEKQRNQLVQACAGCHQMPSPAVRHYARLIDDTIAGLGSADPADVRRQSWAMIERYMNLLSEESAFHGQAPEGPASAVPDPNAVSGGIAGSGVADILSEYFLGPMDRIQTYRHGAPLLATPETVLSEYELESPYAVGDALMLGTIAQLWTADSSGDNTVIRVDPPTGVTRKFEIPLAQGDSIAPYLIRRGAGGTLWVASRRHGAVARYDPDNREWFDVARLKDDSGDPVAIDALGVGIDHEVEADAQGHIWFFDMEKSSVGNFAPGTGKAEIVALRETPGSWPLRSIGSASLVMSADREKLWFSDARAGALGMIDIATRKYETIKLRDRESGIRGIAMNEEGVLFAALMGSGQLLEYRPTSREQIFHELPDRASAPQSVTYDPVRKVIWIATSNGDLIYRFEPGTGEFSVIPLPRQGASLRSLAVDPVSGKLVTSYKNELAAMNGARSALVILVIEPGDGAYRARIAPPAEKEDKSDAQ